MTASVRQLNTEATRSARLREAGWKAKERLGRAIWQHPESGFYYSEEMALEMVRSEDKGEER